MPQKWADSLREWGQGRSGRELGWRSVHVSRSPLRVSRVPLPHGHLASSQGALFSPRVEAEVGSCQMWGAHARGCPAQHQSTAPGSFQLLPQPERLRQSNSQGVLGSAGTRRENTSPPPARGLNPRCEGEDLDSKITQFHNSDPKSLPGGLRTSPGSAASRLVCCCCSGRTWHSQLTCVLE